MGKNIQPYEFVKDLKAFLRGKLGPLSFWQVGWQGYTLFTVTHRFRGKATIVVQGKDVILKDPNQILTTAGIVLSFHILEDGSKGLKLEFGGHSYVLWVTEPWFYNADFDEYEPTGMTEIWIHKSSKEEDR